MKESILQDKFQDGNFKVKLSGRTL